MAAGKPSTTQSPGQAIAAAGALTRSGGSGTTPTLLGFGDSPDKLVVIADADPTGTNLVAFWRDKIPKASGASRARSRRASPTRSGSRYLARDDQAHSPADLGNGVIVLNTSYPKRSPIAGVTRDRRA